MSKLNSFLLVSLVILNVLNICCQGIAKCGEKETFDNDGVAVELMDEEYSCWICGPYDPSKTRFENENVCARYGRPDPFIQMMVPQRDEACNEVHGEWRWECPSKWGQRQECSEPDVDGVIFAERRPREECKTECVEWSHIGMAHRRDPCHQFTDRNKMVAGYPCIIGQRRTKTNGGLYVHKKQGIRFLCGPKGHKDRKMAEKKQEEKKKIADRKEHEKKTKKAAHLTAMSMTSKKRRRGRPGGAVVVESGVDAKQMKANYYQYKYSDDDDDDIDNDLYISWFISMMLFCLCFSCFMCIVGTCTGYKLISVILPKMNDWKKETINEQHSEQEI